MAEQLEEINWDSFELLCEALEQLPATMELADVVREAVTTLNLVMVDVGPAEAFREFSECHDAAEEALFAFIDLRDADSYPGIGEERAEAWTEAESCFDLLADAWEQVAETSSDTVTPPE